MRRKMATGKSRWKLKKTGIRFTQGEASFGVFDGHGGASAANFAAEHLHTNIREKLAWDDSNVQKAVRDAYLKTEEEFASRNCDDGARSGTCCVSALVFKGSLIVSNVGDCRAVVSGDGVTKTLTTDHLPSVTSEKERIVTNVSTCAQNRPHDCGHYINTQYTNKHAHFVSQGGYVDCYHGIWRIQGSFAVSRSIGDRHLKQWVIAEPDTRILPISLGPEFLILASDGLWDKVSDQEAVDVARPLPVGKAESHANYRLHDHLMEIPVNLALD
ncbi:hypothetical protein MLD38_002680 [Melastoma candidum]|uniref:Uncharacterized protein n=1 Tax=Melastoma candidum TaxID=119954 RepID=A0ACB9S095_9MYRT|nr:hypothetical protein MLD38_002680 [Melastoma candidum]